MNYIIQIAINTFIFLMSSGIVGISTLLGLLFFRVFKQNTLALYESLIHCFWIGFTILTALLMVINMFAPIQFAVVIPVLGILSLTAIIINKTYIVRNIRFVFSGKILLLVALTGVIATLLVRTRFETTYAFDMINYHFQLLRLANEFPAIKGIINVFGHYGNTYSTTYITALVKLFLFGVDKMEAYLFLVFPTVLMYGLFLSIVLMLQPTRIHTAQDQFVSRFLYCALLVIAFFCTLPFSVVIPTESGPFFRNISDISYYIMGIVLLVYFFKYLSANQSAYFPPLIFIALSLVFLKLSAAVLAFVVVIASGVIYCKRRQSLTLLITTLIVAVALLSAYLITNGIKSGALVFPVSFTDLKLPWSNRDILTEYTEGVMSYARSRGAYEHSSSLLNFGWVFSWWIPFYARFLIMYAVVCVVLTVVLLRCIRRHNDTTVSSKTGRIVSIAVFLYAPPFLYWFIMAPDFRFAGILTLVPIVILLSLILNAVMWNKKTDAVLYSNKTMLQYILLVTAVVAVLYPGFQLKVLLFVAGGLLLFGAMSHGKAVMMRAMSLIERAVLPGDKVKFLYGLLLVTVVLQIDFNKTNAILRIPNNDSRLTKVDYDGVTIYQALWKHENVCSHTKKLPCGYVPNSKYTFVDSKYWWKGIIKRSTMEKE